MIRAAWPDRGPTWPVFQEGGAVLRIADADTNNWLPRALRSALAQPQPAAATAPAPTQAAAQVAAQTADAREWGGELGPLTHAPPQDTAWRRSARHLPRVRGRRQRARGERTAPQPSNR